VPVSTCLALARTGRVGRRDGTLNRRAAFLHRLRTVTGNPSHYSCMLAQVTYRFYRLKCKVSMVLCSAMDGQLGRSVKSSEG
jgi:hypothetical protein